MSDFLNIKDFDLAQATPSPEELQQSPILTGNRKLMNTLNVELSDQQTKFLMMQSEIGG